MTMDEASGPAEMFQLDRPTCVALLTTQHVGRLIIGAADPVVRVVNYTAFEHIIMFRSDPGPQIETILDHPVVFEVDMFDERTHSGWSVIVHGTARDLSDHLAGLAQSGANVEPWAPGPKNRWIGIAIDDITGRLLRGEVRPPSVDPHAYC
jgi:nitroimidazol reductase NimA-like FMN-containing flavoprotein (pyridoxamine 5'-phosphate oxidase superfamily)